MSGRALLGRALGALFVLFALCPRSAGALAFDDFVQVSSESELHDLYEQGQLDDAQYDALLELRAAPFDLADASAQELYLLPNLRLDTAEAIVAHRAEGGDTSSLEALVEAGLLTAAEADALVFFVEAPAPPGERSVRGNVRLASQGLVRGGAPPALLSARLRAGDVDMGLSLTLGHQALGRVSFDPARGGLVARAPSTRVAAPRFHLRYARGPVDLLAGTFRLGFAEGLTLDNTGLRSPEGARVDASVQSGYGPARPCRLSAPSLLAPGCDGPLGARWVAPDYRSARALRGLYAARAFTLGRATLTTHAFGSFATYDVYQYSVYDAGRCLDPNTDDAACASPPVYVASAGVPDGSRYLYASLPRLLDVGLAGGRLRLAFGDASVGVTGYGALPRYRVAGLTLGTRASGGLPYGGAFGAVGVDARLRVGALGLGVELSRSFDAMPTGGGYAALARGTLALTRGELELSGRVYDARYANPYFGAVAAPDAYRGFRARDELGLRLRYAGEGLGGRLRARVVADLYRRPSLRALRAQASARADLALGPSVWLGAVVAAADRDLVRVGRGGCYEGEASVQGGVSEPCGGARFSGGLRLRYAPSERGSLLVQYDHRFVDQKAGRMRQGAASSIAASWAPIEALRLCARVRHSVEGLARAEPPAQQLAAYAESALRLVRPGARCRVRLSLRYSLAVSLERGGARAPATQLISGDAQLSF